MRYTWQLSNFGVFCLMTSDQIRGVALVVSTMSVEVMFVKNLAHPCDVVMLPVQNLVYAFVVTVNKVICTSYY